MKKIKNTLVGLLVISLVGGLSSCSDYLDINTNPNYPATAEPNTLLPSALASTAMAVGFQYEIFGTFWAQHATQHVLSNQYNTFVTYNITSSSSYSGRAWSNFYAMALPDLDLIIKQTEKSGTWNYWVIAKVMMAYDFLMLTDAFGDVPFTEALLGDGSPKYDDSKSVIYPGIIAMLDEAIAKASDASAANLPVIYNQDYVFSGDISAWTAFAKSLKFKMLMRDFDTNKSAIQTLLNENLLTEDAKMDVFVDQANKSNPLYENDRRMLNTPNNLRATTTLADYLLANNDPRVADFFDLNLAGGYSGMRFGGNSTTDKPGGDASSRIKLDALDPVYLMSAAEVEFLKAEFYARMGNAATAKTHYDDAVSLAFERWGKDASDFISAGGNYEFKSGSTDEMLTCILTQKWVASTRCQAWDAWFDFCRTGIPAMSTVFSDDPSYKVGLFTPSVNASVNGYPHRIPYVNGSLNYNTSAPEAKPINEPLWWHKK